MNPKTFDEIRIGSYIQTPRFCWVKIEAIFADEESANAAGYTEPTHLYDMPYKVLGKSKDMYRMTFAVCKSGQA